MTYRDPRKERAYLYCSVLLVFFTIGCGEESQPAVGASPGPSVIMPVAPSDGTAQPGVGQDVVEPAPMANPAPVQVDPPMPLPAQMEPPAPVPPPPEPPMPEMPMNMAPPPVEMVRFVALGDSGKANAGQVRVAEAITDVCTAMDGCNFVLLLGDNIYDAGAESAQDPVWITHFEEPYAGVDLPFYATLGNHDYGAPSILEGLGGGIGIERARGLAQVAYAATQDKFRMPDEYYRFARGAVEFVSLDTATLFWRDLDWAESTFNYAEVNEGQERALPQWAEEPLAPWRIAFGHHPYLSNGRHGNAGNYDGVPEGIIGSGTALKAFFENHILGNFHVYLSGHEHLLQDLGEVDGTELIVSGAGASTTDIEWRNDYEWQSDALGFVMIDATSTTMTFRFFEVAAEDEAMLPWVESHTRTITRLP